MVRECTVYEEGTFEPASPTAGASRRTKSSWDNIRSSFPRILVEGLQVGAARFELSHVCLFDGLHATLWWHKAEGKQMCNRLALVASAVRCVKSLCGEKKRKKLEYTKEVAWWGGD
jgi:hypothetical protein